MGDLSFISDNQTGVHPKVLERLQVLSGGNAAGYGEDDWTAMAESAVQQIFETECAVFFVSTGTAANALALSALSSPGGRFTATKARTSAMTRIRLWSFIPAVPG